jgi:tetratricopeptide (TPR) repeat protein
MPPPSPSTVKMRLAVPARPLGWLCLLLVAVAALSGCRALGCRKVSDESINEARQLSLQARDAQQKGRWERAEEFYAAAVARCPTDERARCGYAESLWQRDARLDAVAHMEEGVRLSGDDPERVVQLGKMYLERGELLRAAVQAEKAISANRQLASAWALRGDVQRAEGSRTAALVSYHRALCYQPQFPEVQLALADVHSQDGKPQRALATIQALAQHYPAGQIPYDISYRQGLALRSLARYRESAECLAAAARQPNPSVELLCDLARSQALAGDKVGASQTVTAALRQRPDHAPALNLEQELSGQQGQVAAVGRLEVIR